VAIQIGAPRITSASTDTRRYNVRGEHYLECTRCKKYNDETGPSAGAGGIRGPLGRRSDRRFPFANAGNGRRRLVADLYRFRPHTYTRRGFVATAITALVTAVLSATAMVVSIRTAQTQIGASQAQSQEEHRLASVPWPRPRMSTLSLK
jgi:hypothetical protein